MLYDPKKEVKVEEELFHASLEPWRQLALKAAETIQKRGWCQGRVKIGRRVCLLGGIRMADHGKTDAFPDGTTAQNGHAESEAVSELMRHLSGYLDGFPVGWNDHRKNNVLGPVCYPIPVPKRKSDVVRMLHYFALGDV